MIGKNEHFRDRKKKCAQVLCTTPCSCSVSSAGFDSSVLPILGACNTLTDTEFLHVRSWSNTARIHLHFCELWSSFQFRLPEFNRLNVMDFYPNDINHSDTGLSVELLSG